MRSAPPDPPCTAPGRARDGPPSPRPGPGRRPLLLALPLALALALLPRPGAAAGREPRPSFVPGARIHVLKSARELRLYSGDRLLRTYRVGLGKNPVPPKEREGDDATPEGSYTVCVRNPRSAFLLSLGISYPGLADAERGLKAGLISPAQHRRIVEAIRHGRVPPWDTPLGGTIFIHGRGSATDWTWGCIALDDEDIRELYPLVPLGTPVLVTP